MQAAFLSIFFLPSHSLSGQGDASVVTIRAVFESYCLPGFASGSVSFVKRPIAGVG